MCDPFLTCQVQATSPHPKEKERSCSDYYLETFLFLDNLRDIQLSWKTDGKKEVRFTVVGIPKVLAYKGDKLLSVFNVRPTQDEIEKSEVEMDSEQWFNMKYTEFCNAMRKLEEKKTKPDRFSVQVEFLCTKRVGTCENLPGGTAVTVGNTPWFIPEKWTVGRDKRTLTSPLFPIKQIQRKGGDGNWNFDFNFHQDIETEHSWRQITMLLLFMSSFDD